MTLTQVNQLPHIQAIIELAKSKNSDSEQVFIINHINWQEYENLLEFMSDNSGVLFKYEEETLVIMSPSRNHEIFKENIGILIETYCLIKKIKFYSLGSTTFRSQKKLKGIEPDKSYCFNSRKEFPDLAIEIIITSGGINSLQIYRDLGVKEVWFWEREKLTVYHLEKEEYQKVQQSRLLPDIDLDLFANLVIKSEPLEAILEFTKTLEEK
ncbi:Uma2 family endonuclease [Geminocystis herdmanii]|uniref:Uma2 family endonuclease n=1 Tax=Geminocystis herdmanii TaxID=669359 RepID=UPI000345A4BC|nr:Uma2 family endonuclease [Geminocystis herdmanii]